MSLSVELVSLLFLWEFFFILWFWCSPKVKSISLSLTEVLIYEALCFDVAQGQMNGAPNETRTHSCRFASLVC